MKMMKMMKLEKRKRAAAVNKTAETSKKKKGVYIYIPGDIIVSEILLRLPARSLGRFRCVCKSWLSVTSSTAFVGANARLNRITRPSVIVEDLTRPTEICWDFAGDANSSESAIGFREYQHPTKCIPKRSFAIASCDGLVCIIRLTCSVFQYYVINPLTGQSSIAMPIEDCPDDSRLTLNLGLYSHRSTSKYRLIRFIEDVNSMGASEVLVVGGESSSWRRIPGNFPVFFQCQTPLDINGNMYWKALSRSTSSSEDTVVIFDQEQEVYSVISLPPSLDDLGGRILIDFNGELGVLVAGCKDNTIDVWLMEENSWIKRYSVNYPHIHGCPSLLITPWWPLTGAVIIGDEELLVKLSGECHCGNYYPYYKPRPYCKSQHYLVRCNLKSGACAVQPMMAAAQENAFNKSIFSYTETLTNPE